MTIHNMIIVKFFFRSFFVVWKKSHLQKTYFLKELYIYYFINWSGISEIKLQVTSQFLTLFQTWRFVIDHGTSSSESSERIATARSSSFSFFLFTEYLMQEI